MPNAAYLNLSGNLCFLFRSVEGEKEKCRPYWPIKKAKDNQGETLASRKLGNLVVTLQACQNGTAHIQRMLSVFNEVSELLTQLCYNHNTISFPHSFCLIKILTWVAIPPFPGDLLYTSLHKSVNFRLP